MKWLLILMLIPALGIAQQRQFDFKAVDAGKDTLRISTGVKSLALEWKDGHTELYPYDKGVYAIGETAEIICFDDFSTARYMMIYYTSAKHDQISYGYLQYSNGTGVEFDVINKKHGR